MEINERDGKYFLKISNGELELNEKQLQVMLEKGAVIRNNLRNWIDNFLHRQWATTKMPHNAAAYIKADEYFNSIIKELEDIYLASNNKIQTLGRIIDFCNTQIQKLKIEALKAQDVVFTDYHIICWLRVIVFFQGLTGIHTSRLKELVS